MIEKQCAVFCVTLDLVTGVQTCALPICFPVTIYFTGTEQAVITDPYFLFVFTNRATGDEVKVVVTNTSSSENRYDKGVVDGVIFNTFDTGLWGNIKNILKA